MEHVSTPYRSPGLALSAAFFAELVQPILAAEFPGLVYGAGLLGTGSEVLGFDDEMSRDHDWGPRVDLFVDEDASPELRHRIDEALRNGLPTEFRGYPVSFTPPNPDDNGTRLLDARTSGPVDHKIAIQTISEFVRSYLGLDLAQPIAPCEWLTLPEQKLRTIASGPIFHDGVGLHALQQRWRRYPDDVWRYLLASGWTRIGQEEHLMGRAGIVGDEIGSALIGARLVRDLMRLCFLMERVYAPYAKWFGSAFQQLACAAELSPHMSAALAARSWSEREAHLVRCYELVAAQHNALGITEPLPTTAQRFFNRPLHVIAQHGFADAIAAGITDADVRRLLDRSLIGSIDQFSDSTDLVSDPRWRPVLKGLYE